MATAILLKILSVALQYGILLLLLFFMVRVTGYMLRDLRESNKRIAKRQAAPQGAVLEVMASGDGTLDGLTFSVAGELAIGRAPDNDIVLNDSYVSHHHAVITRRKNLYVIEDLDSVNHTYVNHKELKGRAYLKPGDLIRIGMATLKFGR